MPTLHNLSRHIALPLIALAVLAFSPAKAHAQIKTWIESPGVMVLPDRAAGESGQIERTVVRNTYATAQIGMRSETAVERSVSLEWTSLKGAGDAQIPRDQIMIYRAADIHVDHGEKVDPAKVPERTRPLGDYPDALVPLLMPDGTNVANTITPEAGRALSFWVDIFVPESVAPGDYQGTINLKSGNDLLTTIPVKLHVLNLQIPAQSTLPSLFNLRPFPNVKENLDAYVAEIIRHRVQPFNYHYIDYYSKKGMGFEMLDKYNPNGQGCACIYVNVAQKLSDADAAELIDNLHKVTDHLKEKKLFDHAYLYLKDEPDAREIPFIADAAKLILKEVPEWKGKLLDTLNSENNDLDPMLDYTARALKVYGGWYQQVNPPGGRDAWDARRAKGQHLWFYVSNAQGVPFPTFDINTPQVAFEPRVLGWAYWYEKAEGHLYWDLLADEKWTLSRKFPPGDGQLIYPGDFSLPGAPTFVQIKDIKGPVISRRLKLQRQGLEEWELLKMAEAKVGREKVAAIVDQVYTCLGQRTWSPNAYDPKKPMWSYEEKAWDDAHDKIVDLLLN